jgi:hypothetical protein
MDLSGWYAAEIDVPPRVREMIVELPDNELIVALAPATRGRFPELHVLSIGGQQLLVGQSGDPEFPFFLDPSGDLHFLSIPPRATLALTGSTVIFDSSGVKSPSALWNACSVYLGLDPLRSPLAK